jgi:tRNA(fMet)-specific endonuclease VapC
MELSLLDTDTLSEIMKARNLHVVARAEAYLSEYGGFTFSIITRYEVLRGLRAKAALRQVAAFDQQCALSTVLPLTDAVVQKAAEVYGELYQRGELLADADILIAATALVNGLPLVTGNARHFRRVSGLLVDTWHLEP